jgi:hypothetical protein
LEGNDDTELSGVPQVAFRIAGSEQNVKSGWWCWSSCQMKLRRTRARKVRMITLNSHGAAIGLLIKQEAKEVSRWGSPVKLEHEGGDDKGLGMR